MTSLSVCVTSREHFIISHPYRDDIIQCIYDIISSIYDITHTAFMKTQQVYLTSHPPHLTSQPLHLCGHTRSNNAITIIMEVITLGTRMTSSSTSHSDFMTSILSIYDITNTTFMTSDLLYMTSHPWFIKSHPLSR